MPVRTALPTLAGASLLLALAAPARADLMAACAPAIAQFCADVQRGRGRIAACLASHQPALASTCRAEVVAVAQSPVVPRYARTVLDPRYRAALPQTCATAAARFCPDVPSGDGRVLACLYARSDRVDAGCISAVRASAGR
jgi:golgi apparatus protein 1